MYFGVNFSIMLLSCVLGCVISKTLIRNEFMSFVRYD